MATARVTRGKSGEGGVGAEGQGQEDRPHGEVEEPAPPEDGHDDQAEQALVAGSRVHRHDAILLGQPGGAEAA